MGIGLQQDHGAGARGAGGRGVRARSRSLHDRIGLIYKVSKHRKQKPHICRNAPWLAIGTKVRWSGMRRPAGRKSMIRSTWSRYAITFNAVKLINHAGSGISTLRISELGYGK